MPPGRQTWQLSQDANKQNGTCSICFATRQLNLKNGTVHLHGPRQNPCPGSHKPPLKPSQPQLSQQTPPDPLLSSSPMPSTVLDGTSSTQPPAATSQPIITSTPSTFQHPGYVHVIKRIPKSDRPACCRHLTDLLSKVNGNHTDITAWSALLGFGQHILQQPARGGKRHNLTSTIKIRTTEAPQLVIQQSDIPCPQRRKQTAAETLAAAVSAKIEDGNIRAALRILNSDDQPADVNQDTLTKLESKHPAAPTDRAAAPDPNAYPACYATDDDVLKAIRSFPAGSSGGPDGIRPQHLLDLVTCLEGGSELLKKSDNFRQHAAQWQVSSVRHPGAVRRQSHSAPEEVRRHPADCDWLRVAQTSSQMRQRVRHQQADQLLQSEATRSRCSWRLRGGSPRNTTICPVDARRIRSRKT